MLFAAFQNEDDKNKIAKIFKRYYSLMMSVAMKILGDYALAEDAVSESVIKLIKNLHKIGGVDCHKTAGLIVIIVKNTAKDIRRKRSKDRKDREIDLDYVNEFLDLSISVLDEVIGLEGYERILEIFDSLTEPYRDLCELAFIYGYDYKEIAEMLDISYDLVRKRISRARNMIRNKLNEYEEAEHGQ